MPGNGYAVTVIAAVPFLVPSTVLVAVMVALPTATPVTTPEVLTVALLTSELDQVTVWVAPTGATVAARLVVAATATLAVDGATVTPVGAGGAGRRVMVGDTRRAV
ncbi:hypothetical protein EMIT047CA2_90059 [Pseudomonas soli]